MRLQGKVCLVTGAARGIGAEIARTFAREGGKVVLTDQRGDEVETLAAEIGQVGLSHDVSDEAQWVDAIAKTEDRFGRLDVVVANAGYGWLRAVTDIDYADWKRLMAVNLDGVFLALKHGIPLMARSGGGSIITMSSIFGLVGGANSTAYSASKGAVTMMTKSAALECAERGLNIRVNSIHPGNTLTPLAREVLTDAEIDEIGKKHALCRFARVAEIAAAVTFLASDEASFMTGSQMVVDGGYTAG